MLGIMGSTIGLACGGTPARMAAPRSVPTPTRLFRSKAAPPLACIWSTICWGTPFASSRWGSRLASWVPNSEPAIESPTVPPIWRKNVRFDVATPSLLKGTAFWMTMVKTARVGPIPTPVTNCQTQMVGIAVAAASWVKSTEPMPRTVSAPSSSTLYLPVRATIWPLTMLELITPIRSGIRAYPLAVADSPRTTW